MTYHTTLLALADPTRRRLLERLRRRPHTVGELALAQGISQPAVSQHLRALRGARLVAMRPEGTRRYYHATLEGLEPLKAWLEAL